jgi:hypothetical protein
VGKGIPSSQPGESREASDPQCARSKSGSASSGCGAGADYALRPSIVLVKQLLQHESFHIESINVADATEGHFTCCKGAAIAEAGLSQERRQVEHKLQSNQQPSKELAVLAGRYFETVRPLDAIRRLVRCSTACSPAL